MKVKKPTVKEVKVGDEYNLKGNGSILKYECHEDGFLKMSDYINGIFTNDLVTITEKPKSYQGSGVMVRFTIPNMDGEYLMFWSNFKEIIDLTLLQRAQNLDDLLSDVVRKPTPRVKKVKKVKVWTENQKKRLAPPGFYIEYYGEPIQSYDELSNQDISVIALGVGKCKYQRPFFGHSKWYTLSWVSAVTKNKLENDKNKKTGKETRFLYFSTYQELIDSNIVNVTEPDIEMNIPLQTVH